MHPLLELSAHPVIGHRGAAGLAPENTIPALELALAQGAAAIEFDVRLAADGVPVLMHDPTLDRTTEVAGPVSQRTSRELATIDAGYRFTADAGSSFPWRGRAAIPTLRSVLERFPATPLLIELKTVEVAQPALLVLSGSEHRDQVVLASFLEEALIPFRKAGFATGASRRSIARLWLASLVGLGRRGPAGPDRVFAVPDRYKDLVPVPTPSFIRAARRTGRPVHVWTVDDPTRAELLWRRGVSGIITNFPGRLVAERRRLFPAEL